MDTMQEARRIESLPCRDCGRPAALAFRLVGWDGQWVLVPYCATHSGPAFRREIRDGAPPFAVFSLS